MQGNMAADLLIRIAADTAQVRSEMNEVRRSVGGSLSPLGDMADVVGGKLRNMLAGLATGAAVAKFIEMADAARLLEARLKLAVGSGDAFVRAQRDIYEISQRNSAGIEEMTQLYTKLHAPVERLGGTTRETTGIVEAFSAALKVGGANTQEAASATLQFAQAMASGRLNGDEFRSMTEASPRFMKALADGMGVPIEKLKEMSTQGKLTADVVGNALMKELANLRAEAATMPDTVGQAFTRLKNEVTVAVGEFERLSGAAGGVAEMVSLAAEMFGATVAALKDLFEATGRVNTGLGTTEVIAFSLGKVFEAVVLVASDVGFVINGIGREIGGMAAQVAAVMRGDFAGAKAIGEEMRADAEASRKALDEFQGRVSGMTDRIMQAREAQRQHSLSAAENGAELAKLGRQAGDTSGGFVKLKSAVSEANKEAQKQSDTYTKLQLKLAENAAALAAEAQGLEKLNPMQKLRADMVAQLDAGLLKLSPTQRRHVREILDQLVATEDANVERRKSIQIADELEKRFSEETRAIEENANAIWDQVRQHREANEEIGLTREQLDRLRVARLRDAEAAAMQRMQDEMNGAQRIERIAAIQSEIDALRRLIELKESGAAKEWATDSAREAADAWRQTADSIASGLTNAFMTAAANGRSIWVSVRDYIKATLLQAFVGIPLQQFLSGMLGGASMAGAAGGGGLGGMVGMAKDAYSIGSGAYSAATGYSGWVNTASSWLGAGSTAGAATGSLAYANLVGAAGGDALGAFIAANGSWGGVAAGGGAAAGGAAGASGGAAAAGGGSMAGMGAIAGYAALAAAAVYLSDKWYDQGYTGSDRFGGVDDQNGAGLAYQLSGTKEGKQILSALGVSDKWAEILSGSVGLNWLFDKMGMLKTPHAGGYVMAGADGSLQDITKQQGGIQNANMQDMVGSFTKDVLALYSGFAESFGAEGKIGSIRSVFESDNRDPSWALFHILGLDGNQTGGFSALGTLPSKMGEGFKAFTDQAAGSILDALRQLELPKWVKDELGKIEGAITLDGLTSKIINIESFRQAMDAATEAMAPLGGVFANLAQASSDAKFKIIDLAGGLEAFGAKVNDYVSSYYSQDEQMALAAQQLLKDAQAAGLTGIGGFNERSDLRARMDSLDPETQGEEMVALLNIASAFAPIADYLSQNGLTLDELAGKAPESAIVESLLTPAEETAEATKRTANAVEELSAQVEQLSTVVASQQEQLSSAVRNIENTMSVVFTGDALQVETV